MVLLMMYDVASLQLLPLIGHQAQVVNSASLPSRVQLVLSPDLLSIDVDGNSHVRHAQLRRTPEQACPVVKKKHADVAGNYKIRSST